MLICYVLAFGKNIWSLIVECNQEIRGMFFFGVEVAGNKRTKTGCATETQQAAFVVYELWKLHLPPKQIHTGEICVY